MTISNWFQSFSPFPETFMCSVRSLNHLRSWKGVNCSTPTKITPVWVHPGYLFIMWRIHKWKWIPMIYHGCWNVCLYDGKQGRFRFKRESWRDAVFQMFQLLIRSSLFLLKLKVPSQHPRMCSVRFEVKLQQADSWTTNLTFCVDVNDNENVKTPIGKYAYILNIDLYNDVHFNYLGPTLFFHV